MLSGSPPSSPPSPNPTPPGLHTCALEHGEPVKVARSSVVSFNMTGSFFPRNTASRTAASGSLACLLIKETRRSIRYTFYVNRKILILLERHIEMLAAQCCLCSGNHDDRLCVVDNHRRPSHFIPNLQLLQQKYRRVRHPSDLVKINASRRRHLRTLRSISREAFYL